MRARWLGRLHGAAVCGGLGRRRQGRDDGRLALRGCVDRGWRCAAATERARRRCLHGSGERCRRCGWGEGRQSGSWLAGGAHCCSSSGMRYVLELMLVCGGGGGSSSSSSRCCCVRLQLGLQVELNGGEAHLAAAVAANVPVRVCGVRNGVVSCMSEHCCPHMAQRQNMSYS